MNDPQRQPPAFFRSGSIASLTALLFLTTFLFAGCGQHRPGVDWMDALPVASVDLELWIGGYAADLVPITWMGVSPNGTIAITQGQDYSVRFFDPDGAPLGKIGTRGAGPGEFQAVGRVGWVGDTLWVADGLLNRVTLISPELGHVRTILAPSLPRPQPGDEGRWPVLRTASPVAAYAGDTLLVIGSPASDHPHAEAFPLPLTRVTSDGFIVRYIANRPTDLARFTFMPRPGAYSWLYPPYQHRGLWTVQPDGGRIATLSSEVIGPEGGLMHLTVYDAEGSAILARTYSYAGRPIPEHVADSALAAAIDRIPVAVPHATQVEARSMIPPIYAPAREILLGMDSTIWIGLRPANDEENTWLILNGDGEPIGRAMLPGSFTLGVASAARIWGFESDELGMHSVVRYELGYGGRTREDSMTAPPG